MIVPIAIARTNLLASIERAARRAGRDPAGVEVVAVSKGVPPERIGEAVDAGFRVIGENRVQDAEAKADEVAEGLAAPPAWHLVGPLQSNKVRRAVALFDLIQAVDRLDLARRIDRIAGEVRPDRRYPILLQVNVDADAAKAGFAPTDLERDLDQILDLPNLRVEGLMTVGRLVRAAEAARPTFVALRRLSEDLRNRHAGLGPALSMGMTDDFPVAVEEGASLVRIGRAIFGHRH